MAYRVEIRKQASKELSRIGAEDRGRIGRAIEGLADDPRPPGCQKLRGRDGWRIRVGDCRVLYEIQDQRLVVVVVRVGHRKEVYRED